METKRSTAWDGKRRTLLARRCEKCSSKFWAPAHILKNGHGRFCSKECRVAAMTRKIKVKCAFCRSAFFRIPSKTRKGKRRKHGKFFCDRRCKERAQATRAVPEICPSHYGSAKTPSAYRAKAFRWRGQKCEGCGYAKDKRMLDVHHVDGDRSNDRLSNLAVLCVWCHLSETRGVKEPGLPRKPKPQRTVVRAHKVFVDKRY